MKAAMALIAARGVDGFSLADLSRRARVAQKTLYNSFGSKEALICAAFDFFLEEQAVRFPATEKRTMAGILDQLYERCCDFMQNREWVRASNFLYFSFTVDEEIYGTLKAMALIYFDQFHKVYGDHPDFVTNNPTEYLRLQMANAAHGTVHDWLMGRISDRVFPDAVCLGVVTAMMSFVSGDLRREAGRLVERYAARLRDQPLPSQDSEASASGE
ncbi:TetR/AcrR family transcriptional regulator [Novosphingobium marinum]|uniref:TetR/AcrR family transcriptional regulator n=1 Tax=Novosphingobium marinum TaxID=1514948 RepID=UPI00227A41A8|nr:TetR/AcrR family transcriptional regulator [Novosphingobium marinum]